MILVHGWTGRPSRDWFPWAKAELKKAGFEVYVPRMLDPDYPKIKPWVEKIRETVIEPRPDDILVGHSMGCQGILRYLATLPEGAKIQKVILIAGFEDLKGAAFDALEDWETFKPWKRAKIDYERARRKPDKWIALFSDDDPFVDYEANSRIFKEKLGAKIVLQKGMKHFSQEDKVLSLPILLELIKK